MQSANVTNVSKHPLGFPNGEFCPLGGTVRIEKWNIVKNHHVVSAWLDVGMIEVLEVDGENGVDEVVAEIVATVDGDVAASDEPAPAPTDAPAADLPVETAAPVTDAPVEDAKPVNPFAKSKK